jgi:hypothetical protein
MPLDDIDVLRLIFHFSFFLHNNCKPCMHHLRMISIPCTPPLQCSISFSLDSQCLRAPTYSFEVETKTQDRHVATNGQDMFK